jgi:hypothetical protein
LLTWHAAKVVECRDLLVSHPLKGSSPNWRNVF